MGLIENQSKKNPESHCARLNEGEKSIIVDLGESDLQRGAILNAGDTVALAYVLNPTTEEKLRLGEPEGALRQHDVITGAAIELSGLDTAHAQVEKDLNLPPVEVDPEDVMGPPEHEEEEVSEPEDQEEEPNPEPQDAILGATGPGNSSGKKRRKRKRPKKKKEPAMPTRRSRRILEKKAQTNRSSEVIADIEGVYGQMEPHIKQFCLRYQEYWKRYHETANRIFNQDLADGFKKASLEELIMYREIFEEERCEVNDFIQQAVNDPDAPGIEALSIVGKHDTGLDRYYWNQIKGFDSWILHRRNPQRYPEPDPPVIPETPGHLQSPSLAPEDIIPSADRVQAARPPRESLIPRGQLDFSNDQGDATALTGSPAAVPEYSPLPKTPEDQRYIVGDTYILDSERRRTQLGNTPDPRIGPVDRARVTPNTGDSPDTQVPSTSVDLIDQTVQASHHSIHDVGSEQGEKDANVITRPQEKQDVTTPTPVGTSAPIVPRFCVLS